ncbi:SUMF1/EgtB/PvdO family nonheme iron enzyme [Haliangium ochraceum]|uniref:Adenylate/guanylate cyclase n=1 Tax=Haliangium ochraceum (strain DSM 14365 / JCM 11303 / SMP-2) TaxID=502025 RepID=D0LV07_HALO1|nr:SUMF1/EgtB/PvdO family nonheme iron enzyme [Haliangium ochraceum]ACY15848.1 adenylate/guanylate cyclase [Haliangium ochraceum DSM 14365]
MSASDSKKPPGPPSRLPRAASPELPDPAQAAVSGPDEGGEGEARVDDLLRAKADIEASLRRYQRFSAVLFTDIAGSTAYFTKKGDLAGRLMVQRHDDLLFPIVEELGGRVVKTTGDGMLAAFDESRQACEAAVRMQQTMVAFNATQEDPDEELHIHVAMHAGVGFHDENDIYGNLVNIAARVEKLAQRDQILLTEVVHGGLEQGQQGACRLVGEHSLKGIDHPYRIYELAWQGLPAEVAPVQAAPGASTRVATILVTDVEDSGRLWERAPEAMRAAHGRYEGLVREHVERRGGVVFKTVGDTISAAFSDVGSAAAAAVSLQRALQREVWTALDAHPFALQVRVGVHTGRVEMRGGAYIGPAVASATRLNAFSRGSQILLTDVTCSRLRAHLPEGFLLHEHGPHALQGTRGAEPIWELSASGLPAPGRPLRVAQHNHPSHRLRFEVSAPAAGTSPPGGDWADAADGAETGQGAAGPALARLWRALADAIRDDSRTVELSAEETRSLIQHKPTSFEEYWLGRFVEWSQPRFRLDTRFVQLSLLIDRGEEQADERWHLSEQRIEDLGNLLSLVKDPALVFLAPPGSGKSTILRRIEVDAATAALRGGAPRITFFVQLNHFRPAEPDAPMPSPAAWLAERWHSRYPDLPPLPELLAEGRVTLLLDGLNEIPTPDDGVFRTCVRMWKDFAAEVTQRRGSGEGNRLLFSCRSLDYSAPLSSPSLRVPQVRIEPMSNRQIRQYLKLSCPAHWAEVWQEIADSPNLELLRTPYFLRLMVEQIEAEGRIPQGRAELFSGFVRHTLRREVERDNPLFDDESLLSSRDRRQIVRWRWKHSFDLPERGALLPGLAQLAFRMQESLSTTSGAQVRVDFDDALEMLMESVAADEDAAEALIRAGEALALLDEDPASDEVLFVHQLVQEYFAARALARRPQPALARAPWRIGEVPALAETIRDLGPADPLPPLPTTGWEETTIMAAAMADDADAFVRGVAAENLVLAGRCAAQREVGERLRADTRGELRRALMTRLREPEADLRARIAAGEVLGAVGGPMYEKRAGADGDYLAPPMIAIAAGVYHIGSETPYEYRDRTFDEELPSCAVAIAAFSLGQFPVTNAEWAYFMAGGGYEDERFWDGDDAKAWLRGEGTAMPLRNVARYWRQRFASEPALVDKEFASDHMDRSMYELWQRRLLMDEATFERHLVEHYPARRETEPRHWRNPRFNNPMQPVIGISWFEARAYTAWLAAQTGQPYRLPTEAEWEAAARGREGRAFAYGDTFDPLRGNTLETHLRQPAPVGAFPSGDTPEGVADLTGNVYDLTSSLWGSQPFVTDWPYPYDAGDGREDPYASMGVSRVTRGGSWYVGRVHARAAYRGRDRYDLRPDDWLTYRGFRLALSLDAGAK